MHDRPSARALLPLALFLLLFFGAGLYFSLHGEAMGFYKLRAPVAILPAIALALAFGRRGRRAPADTLLAGMGEPNVMLMCLIFLLAGAFATVSRAIGGVDAAVYLGLAVIPPGLVLPGLFAVAALVSLAMGTSMGTIAAVAPIALGLARAAGVDVALAMGTVVGGAMFGDNLSVISDTTIAATRTQGAAMRDKFRENVWIAAPAALATLALLAAMHAGGAGAAPAPAPAALALPYLVVLALAVAGVDVLAVLALGIALAGALGLALKPGYAFATLAGDIYAGFESMVEITLLSMLVGGLGALMREQGGLAWLAQAVARLTRGREGRRAGELGIGALGALADVFTANNTVAVLITGPVAKELAERHGIRPGRSASLLDTFTCVLQGVLPYGAQILLAGSIAGLSPLALAGHVHYCWMLGLATLAGIAFGWPQRRAAAAAEPA